MKVRLALSVVLLSLGSLCYASPNVEALGTAGSTVKNAEALLYSLDEVTESRKIDFETFAQKFDVSKIDKSQLVFNVDGSFIFIDSCGNVWEVTYWGMSFGDAVNIAFALDDLLCMLAY